MGLGVLELHTDQALKAAENSISARIASSTVSQQDSHTPAGLSPALQSPELLLAALRHTNDAQQPAGMKRPADVNDGFWIRPAEKRVQGTQ